MRTHFENNGVESPDEIVARRELLAEMPKPEREVLELYYVEGFEPQEVATILGEPQNRVHDLIASLQQRLRTEAMRQALV